MTPPTITLNGKTYEIVKLSIDVESEMVGIIFLDGKYRYGLKEIPQENTPSQQNTPSTNPTGERQSGTIVSGLLEGHTSDDTAVADAQTQPPKQGEFSRALKEIIKIIEEHHRCVSDGVSLDDCVIHYCPYRQFKKLCTEKIRGEKE